MKKILMLVILLVAVGVCLAVYTDGDTDNDILPALAALPLAGAVAKETSPTGIATELQFSQIKAKLYGGTVYHGVGSYTSAELADIVDGMDHLATELAANLDAIGDLAEEDDAIDLKSEQATLKSRTHLVGGKRTNTMQLKFVGLSEAAKNYLESTTFSKTARTFVILADDDENSFVILNGLNWVAGWSAQMDGLWTVVLNTEFGGSTENKLLIYQDVVETAPA
jgi:hypothetical protein